MSIGATAAAASTALTPAATRHTHQLDDEHPSVPLPFLTKKEAAVRAIANATQLIPDVATMVASYCIPFITEKSYPIPAGNTHHNREVIWNLLGLRTMPIAITEEASTSGIKKRIIVSLGPTVLVLKPNGEWEEVITTVGLVMDRAVAAGITQWSSYSWQEGLAALKNLTVTEISTIALGEDLLPGTRNIHPDVMGQMVAAQGGGKDEPLVLAPETAIAMIIHYCVTGKWPFVEVENGQPVQRYVVTASKVGGTWICLGGVVGGPGRGLGVVLNYDRDDDSGGGVLRKFRPLALGSLAIGNGH